MHKATVPDRSQQERQRKIEPEHARMQVAGRNGNRMARAKRHIFKHPAILTQRDFAFRATVEIVENRFRQAPVSKGPEVRDTNYARRGHAALGAGHWAFPWRSMLIRTRRPSPDQLVTGSCTTGQHYSPQTKSASMRRDWSGAIGALERGRSESVYMGIAALESLPRSAAEGPSRAKLNGFPGHGPVADEPF